MGRRLAEIRARRSEIEREIKELQNRIMALQALMAAEADADVIEEFLRDVGVSTPADYAAAMAELNRKLAQLQEELRAILAEYKARVLASLLQKQMVSPSHPCCALRTSLGATPPWWRTMDGGVSPALSRNAGRPTWSGKADSRSITISTEIPTSWIMLSSPSRFLLPIRRAFVN